MNSLVEELREIATALENDYTSKEASSARSTLETLQSRAHKIHDSSSGSWLGYHANVYTVDLKPPPAGFEFDVGWGFRSGQQPGWVSYSSHDIESEICRDIEPVNISNANEVARKCESRMLTARGHVISNIFAFDQCQDPFLDGIVKNLEQLHIPSQESEIDKLTPNDAIVSGDQKAMSQGMKVPPHLVIYVRTRQNMMSIESVRKLKELVELAATHMERRERAKVDRNDNRQNVFIGHGHSLIWRELKDFIQDRLGLEWDEFDRVPAAGLSITERLCEMLDNATFALLLLTADDEQADGSRQARMNVIHEAGLFQGRLGFDRAIILLEEGCADFSNIHGLVQIRFPKGKIGASFEDIRRVLEDREIVSP